MQLICFCQSMLKVNNLTKYFANRLILDNISFSVKENEIVAIIGSNGCGKTTLLKIIAGLETKDQGQVILRKTNHKIKTGLVFQNYRDSMLPWKTIAQNIEFSLSLIIKNFLERRHRLNQLLKQSQLQHHKHKYPYELSGGMAQLAVFTKTIALKPTLFLFDEPFSALDYHSSLKLQKQFLDLWEENKTATLFITHNIDEAIFLADKIIILSNSPTKIVTTIENNLPRPRNFSHLGNDQTHKLKQEILSHTTGFLI